MKRVMPWLIMTRFGFESVVFVRYYLLRFETTFQKESLTSCKLDACRRIGDFCFLVAATQLQWLKFVPRCNPRPMKLPPGRSQSDVYFVF